jgi:hypothetical protein
VHTATDRKRSSAVIWDHLHGSYIASSNKVRRYLASLTYLMLRPFPQAWAAGSVFHLLQAILGLDADGHKKVLYIHPVLPPWLPDITLHNLRVGTSTVTLRFWREKDQTRYEVVDSNGELRVEQREQILASV